MMLCSFELKIRQNHQFCEFELSWGRGQQLWATLPYPEVTIRLYQEWQKAYINFYKTALRARVADTGELAPSPGDWHARLVQAEAKLLLEFHRWLRREELYEIRAKIARATPTLKKGSSSHQPKSVCRDLYLTCHSTELERLPWETWEIDTESGAFGEVRVARTPVTIRSETAPRKPRARRGRARILAILGDDTGVDFQADRQALRSLEKVAEFQFVGWQPEKAIPELKAEICAAITDERGWDVLFFAGHSSETDLTGGELAIAPGTSISVQEIALQLQQARKLGLQFALFNSCSGLSIANSLIDLGLSQVAVMREPIHNKVAQAFLVRFLQVLAQHKDVHDALLAACQDLKVDKNLTYPSAYLIPSLFRHPGAVLFQIEPFGWKQQLKRWWPTRREAVTLGTFAILCFLPPLQNFLLEARVFVQAIYRDVTAQVPSAFLPPVVLVQIDEESIAKAGITDPNPMNRRYLASLVDKLASLDSRVIGIDYLLDRQQPENDELLAQSIRSAVAQKNIWLVFAAIQNGSGYEVGVAPETGIGDRKWSLQGNINARHQYIRLPAEDSCNETCPFAFLLAMVRAVIDASDPKLPQPQLTNQRDFRTQVFDYISQEDSDNNTLAFLRHAKLPAIASLANYFGLTWLRPINDFSLPPDQVYSRISAWQLLDSTTDFSRYRFEQQIVIIAPGGYEEAGITPGADNFPVPLAVAYWQEQRNYTGAESHAYAIHHLLAQHLIVPVPNLWAVGIAALLGKGTTLALRQNRQRKQWAIVLTSATAIYGLVGLQIYIYSVVLLPWLLPSAVFCSYILPILRGKSHD